MADNNVDLETQSENPYARATELQESLRRLINRLSLENGSNTPDFILADYLIESLKAYERANQRRDRWYGFEPFADLAGGDR
jgi:hypothetical protein